MVSSQPDYRFRDENRLPDSKSYQRVFARAKKSRDNLFTVLSRENGTDHARLGLAMSRKNCRRASARNRLKRLVRESFRHHKAELTGLDLVVIALPPASAADNATVLLSLAGHWRKTRAAHPRAS